MFSSVVSIALILCWSLHFAYAFDTRRNFRRERQGLFIYSVVQPGRLMRSQSVLLSTDLSQESDAGGSGGDLKTVQEYSYQIKKAKKKDIKEISRLCVEMFLGDGDDWLHLNREKQRVARDLGSRWSKCLSSLKYVPVLTLSINGCVVGHGL